MRSLFARKPIAALVPEGQEGTGLRRTLGTIDLVALSIGAVIGAGIFSSIGTAAAFVAGQAFTLVLRDGQVDATTDRVRSGAAPTARGAAR